MVLIGPDPMLPWSSTEQEDRYFKKVLRNSLIVFAVVAIAIPFLPVAEITREQKETLPPQLARVILEKKELPKPPPPPPPKPKEEKKPEVKKEKPKEKPKPEPKPVDQVQKAKEKAAISGVLAFQDDLAEMRDSVDVDDLATQNLNRGEVQAAKSERSIITSKAKSSSGGIQTAALSRDTGGAALSGKEDTKVSSDFDKLALKSQGANSASAESGGRGDQSVRRVMDKSKGAIFAIYNRALRKDPTLQGKFVFELVIEPNGTVSEVKLISSDLNNPELENKILSRVKLIRFPADNVIRTRVNYSFDFLPY